MASCKSGGPKKDVAIGHICIVSDYLQSLLDAIN